MPIHRPRTRNIAFGRDLITGSMLLNIGSNGHRSIGPGRQYAAAADVAPFQQLDGMSGIVVISCRKEKRHRVAQTVTIVCSLVFSPPLVRPTALSAVLSPAIVCNFAQSGTSYSAWFGHPSGVGLAFPFSLAAIAVLLAPIVPWSVHIVPCAYSCTSVPIVQLLFFKQPLVIDQIDTMNKAILARAFRGELGANDPAEEWAGSC